MNDHEKQEIIERLGNDVVALIDKYCQLIPQYEVGHQLICEAVSMLLYEAPNELVGVKTILSSVEYGVASYEETHYGIIPNEETHS